MQHCAVRRALITLPPGVVNANTPGAQKQAAIWIITKLKFHVSPEIRFASREPFLLFFLSFACQI